MDKKTGKINDEKVVFKKLDKIIKLMGEKYTVRVGIIGANASAKHAETNLTNASLGAIHEFGATINVTPKMRGYFFKKYGIHKTKKPVVIPARSFLRMPILSKDGKNQIVKKVVDSLGLESVVNPDKKVPAEFKGVYEKKIIALLNPELLATVIGQAAYERVMEAFETGGFGSWTPTSEWSRQNRKYNPANPTLEDTGELRDSITFEVKKA